MVEIAPGIDAYRNLMRSSSLACLESCFARFTFQVDLDNPLPVRAKVAFEDGRRSQRIVKGCSAPG